MARLLEAGVELRAGNPSGAASAALAAEEVRPRPSGSDDGKAFDEFRDLDDLLGGIVEVLTTGGSYLWVPVASVRSMAFQAPRRPRDLLWRRLRLELQDGGGGEVCMPVLYPAAADEEDLSLGHRTDWREAAPGLVRGVGQRCFLIAEEVRPVLSLETVTFGPAA
jgi:type VI secretion system protein ImpE